MRAFTKQREKRAEANRSGKPVECDFPAFG